MPRYTFERSSIFVEQFTVDAATEAEALELVRDGGPQVQISDAAWSDWYDEEYSLEDIEDEVVTFLKSKDTVCATSS